MQQPPATRTLYITVPWQHVYTPITKWQFCPLFQYTVNFCSYLTCLTVFSSLPTTVRPTVPIERWVATQQDIHNHSQWPEITPLIIRVRFTNKSLHNFRSHELCTSNLKSIKEWNITAAHLGSAVVIPNLLLGFLSPYRLTLWQHLKLGWLMPLIRFKFITNSHLMIWHYLMYALEKHYEVQNNEDWMKWNTMNECEWWTDALTDQPRGSMT